MGSSWQLWSSSGLGGILDEQGFFRITILSSKEIESEGKIDLRKSSWTGNSLLFLKVSTGFEWEQDAVKMNKQKDRARNDGVEIESESLKKFRETGLKSSRGRCRGR